MDGINRDILVIPSQWYTGKKKYMNSTDELQTNPETQFDESLRKPQW